MAFTEPTLPIELTGLEVVFLTDSIANKDLAEGLPERDSYVPLARQALLLLGSAYKELVSSAGISPGPIRLEISQEIAWLLRSKVRTGDLAIDGKTNIGIPLLLKLYDILSTFNSELTGLLPLTTTAEPPVSDRDRQFLTLLKAQKEDSDARRDNDPNAGSHESTGG